MEPISAVKRIVWGVELFSHEGNFQVPSVGALKAFARAVDSVIEPVCVLDRSQLPIEIEPLSEEIACLRFTAHSRLRHWLSRVALPGLLPVKFLLQPGSSTRMAAKLLSQYAEESRADFIFVNTHARHGLVRLIHGSFAEGVLHTSRIPVLISNPGVEVGWKYDGILFPTDLGALSREVFEQVVGLAKEIKVPVTLYHEATDLVPLLTTMDVIAPAEVPADPELWIRLAEGTASVWRDWAAASGVPVRYRIEGRSQLLGESIVARAKELGSMLVCMTCNSTELTACVLGSTTHHVVRHSPCPVLVLHTPVRGEERLAPQKAA